MWCVRKICEETKIDSSFLGFLAIKNHATMTKPNSDTDEQHFPLTHSENTWNLRVSTLNESPPLYFSTPWRCVRRYRPTFERKGICIGANQTLLSLHIIWRPNLCSLRSIITRFDINEFNAKLLFTHVWHGIRTDKLAAGGVIQVFCGRVKIKGDVF